MLDFCTQVGWGTRGPERHWHYHAYHTLTLILCKMLPGLAQNNISCDRGLCMRWQYFQTGHCLIQSLTVQFGWAWGNMMWSSAVVARPPQDWVCCAFWDTFLFTTVVNSGYLSYHCIATSSKQSGHSPLITSLVIKVMRTTELMLTVWFWVFFSRF